MSTIKLVGMKSQPATPALSGGKKTIQGRHFLYFRAHNNTELLSPLNWKWKYSNGRNKLTANKASNKNTSSNVSFVFSAVSCFHRPTQSTTGLFLRHFVCRFKWSFSPTLSTVSMMTCDLQVIQSQLLDSSRWELRVCRSEPKKLICCFPNAFLKTPQFIRGAHEWCALKVCDAWILLRSAASPRALVVRRRGKYSGERVWAERTVGEGGGRLWFSPGEFMKSVRMSPRMCSFTATVVALCSPLWCPEQQEVCCSRGRCCPKLGSCWNRPRRPGRWWRHTECSPNGWLGARPHPRIRRPSGSVLPRPSRPVGWEGGQKRRAF